MQFTFSPLLGIAGAALLSGIVGIQRQASAKPAGFRTHVLVATAAAAFTAMGASLNDTRIPSYIVVGIGFLGAGAIAKEGANTRGLTTAATIWVVSAIGMLMGYARSFSLEAALLLTALTYATLIVSDGDLMRFCRIPRKARLRVSCGEPRESARRIAAALKEAGIPFDTADIVNIASEGHGQVAELEYVLTVNRAHDLNGLIGTVAGLPGVRRVEANEPFFIA